MLTRILLLLSIVSITQISPAQLRTWIIVDYTVQPIRMPMKITPISINRTADFVGDGHLQTLSLNEKRAYILSGHQTLWQSPTGWEVHQAEIADLNQDGLPEVVLLVWRNFSPWPIERWLPHKGRIANFHDRHGRSCHIILIGWHQNAFRERWAGSALAEPIDSFSIVNAVGSNQQLLITLEGNYDDPADAPSHYLKVWAWNGFGFGLVSQKAGRFNQVVAAQSDQGQFLLTP